MIKQQRAQAANLLVLDAGDGLMRDRSPAMDTLGASSVQILNQMEYDAMALGEGDLAALGVDEIRNRIAEAEFAVLSANVVLQETDELLAEPYIIREVEGHRIAIIGLTGQAQVPGVLIRDPLRTAKEIASDLQGRADILILLSHVGMGVNRDIAHNVPSIDLIIGGGGAEYTTSPQFVPDGPVIVHADTSTAGHAGRRLGIGTWSFEHGQRIGQTWQSLNIAPNIAPDPEMQDWVDRNL